MALEPQGAVLEHGEQGARVLVVCAHPGDEILGCGGTLALHVRLGHQVRALILGDGWTSRVRSMTKANTLVDLDVIEGKRKELAGRLQRHYGVAQDEAERQIDTWLKSVH